MLRIFQHHLKKLIFPGRLVISAGCLHHMTRAVKLVCLKQICPPLFPVGNGKAGVEIAVLVLGGGDKGNKPVNLFFKLPVRVLGKGICRRRL